MEIKLESDYSKIKRELDEIEVIAPDLTDNFIFISNLMREYYDSEHHLKYNNFKFTHLENDYDVFHSMEDYFNKMNMVAIKKIK